MTATERPIVDSPPKATSTGAPVIAAGMRGIVHGHVVVAVNVLRSRLAEPWTLDSLADEVHLSRSIRRDPLDPRLLARLFIQMALERADTPHPKTDITSGGTRRDP